VLRRNKTACFRESRVRSLVAALRRRCSPTAEIRFASHCNLRAGARSGAATVIHEASHLDAKIRCKSGTSVGGIEIATKFIRGLVTRSVFIAKEICLGLMWAVLP
jgi:hypothetical protein